MDKSTLVWINGNEPSFELTENVKRVHKNAEGDLLLISKHKGADGQPMYGILLVGSTATGKGDASETPFHFNMAEAGLESARRQGIRVRKWRKHSVRNQLRMEIDNPPEAT